MVRATTGLPFDDIRRLIEGPPLPDTAAANAVRQTAPSGLGVLRELVEWLAAWQGRSKPLISQPLIGIFAANHGVVGNQICRESAGTTQAQVERIAAGGAPVSRAVLQSNIGLKVFDLALDLPTPDITRHDVFDEAGCAATMAFGMEAIAGGADLLCVSDIGVGNQVVAAALAKALFGGKATDWLLDEPDNTFRENQENVVETAVTRIMGGNMDPLEILRRVGGREFAAIAGAILAARHQNIPVLLDGFVSVTAAAVLQALNPAIIAHCRVSEAQEGTPMARLLAETGLTPLLDLGLNGGHGLGGVLAIDLCRTATVSVQE